jgi:hypothetical protein
MFNDKQAFTPIDNNRFLGIDETLFFLRNRFFKLVKFSPVSNGLKSFEDANTLAILINYLILYFQ